MIQYIELRSDNIFSLGRSPIIFFISEKVSTKYANEVDGLVDELLKMEYLTIYYCDLDKDRIAINCMTSDHVFVAIPTDKRNYHIASIYMRKEYEAKKRFNYVGKDSFQIMINAGSVVDIYGERRKSEKCGNVVDKGMNESAFNDLQDALVSYFQTGKSKDRDKRPTVDQNFERMILAPIRDYTYCEKKVEEMLSYGENYIVYEKRDAARGNAKKKKVVFYVGTLDPEAPSYQVGSHVVVETEEWGNGDVNKTLAGCINNRELSEDGVAVTIEFFEQFDDAVLPLSGGRIHPKLNDVQTRVREKVVKKIVSGAAVSAWMYSFFSNYRLKDYKEDKGFEEFEKELNSAKYPPTPSQMEAIRKGIETEDLQLVLGPPGTGKTTVIVSWIKYFIRQGKRVLVSSQNNAAVDNVLERVGDCDGAHAIRIGQYEKIQDNCKKFSIEEQIDNEEKRYIETLECSKKGIKEDIQVLNNRIDEVERMRECYKTFGNALENLELQRTYINNLVKQVETAGKNYDEKLGFYEEIYDENVKDRIALQEVAKIGRIKRFLLKRVIDRMRDKESSDHEKLKNSVLSVKETIENYNGSTRMLYAYIKSKEYSTWKTELESYVNTFRNFTIGTKLHGKIQAEMPSDPERDKFGRYKIDTLEEYWGNLKRAKNKNEAVLSALCDWEEIVKKKRNEIISDLLIRNSNIVGATCIGINTRAKFQELDFDVSIIDESGQIQIHNVIVPMTRAPKTLMLGDHLQIPPMVGEEIKAVCEAEGISTKLLEQSFFEYLFKRMERSCSEHITRLKEQFRMPENISEVIAKKFYNGEYYAHYDMSKWTPVIRGTRSPLIFVSTSDEPNRFEQGPTSGDNMPGYANPLEADIVSDIIKSIKKTGDEPSPDLIGIISAYGKQVRLIRKKVAKCKIDLSDEQIQGMVASLDSFQGQERPLIIYSSTRSTSYKTPDKARVGFMKELRRLNVAFTRCKRQLVIIGDFDYLTSCEYEQTDESGNVVEHSSEKEYSEFMSMMLNQVKEGKAELYSARDFSKMLGAL
jgi:superfamily I DNA and/or RNA helicase